MNFKKIGLKVSIVWLGGLVTSPLFAAESRVALSGHVPPQAQRAAWVGRVPASDSVSLSLMVSIDTELMNRTLEQLYGRNAPPNKHFLSSAEFAQKFGLTEKRQKLKDFARANGLTLDPDDRAESMSVKATGSAHLVEKAFSVQLNQYRDAEGNVFRAPSNEPMVPVSLTPDLKVVAGLSNVQLPFHPRLTISGGTGLPAGALSPADLKTIYGLNSVSLDGTGQTVALFEFGPFVAADIATYQAQYGLPNRPPTFVSVDGSPNACTTPPAGTFCVVSTKETTADIEMVTALAPNAQILVYKGPFSNQGNLDIYDRIAMDNLAQVVSTSEGIYEQAWGSLAYLQQWQQIIQRMVVQGQTMFAASGDYGAFDDHMGHVSVGAPASIPEVTGVGGTQLVGSIASYSERAWNNNLPLNAGSSGGGVSAFFPIPNYQVGVPGMASQQFRNVPDVALDADPINSPISIFQAAGGGWSGEGGTSLSAPLWAGFTALINQQRQALGNGVLGFANPVLYQLAQSSAYNTLFNDITLGNNGLYNAGVGYDNVTGWGSFKGNALFNVASTAATLNSFSAMSNVYAYPNPWNARKNSRRLVSFANLPNGATVKIFTVSGFLIKTLTASDGKAIWDLSNDSGQLAASGLYLYVATHGSDKVTGQVALIR